jgi:hypothetical protein
MKICLMFLFTCIFSVANIMAEEISISETDRRMDDQVAVKEKYKNLQIVGFMYEQRSRNMISPLKFMSHEKLKTSFATEKLSLKARQTWEQFLDHTKSNRENFSTKELIKVLKVLGEERLHIDVETLVYLLMIEIAKDSAADIKFMLEQMKSNQERKKQLREQMEQAKKLHQQCWQQDRDPSRTPDSRTCRIYSANELGHIFELLQKEHDSISELSEFQQLNIQAAMERMQQLNKTLSEIMKKVSQVSQAITQNLKQ